MSLLDLKTAVEYPNIDVVLGKLYKGLMTILDAQSINLFMYKTKLPDKVTKREREKARKMCLKEFLNVYEKQQDINSQITSIK